VNRIRPFGKVFNAASALLLVMLILFVTAAGACPSLHKLIHADSHAADHNCAITLFAKGHVSSLPTAPVCASFIIRFLDDRPLENTVAHSVSDVRLSPGRAPPAC
jgi:hypothetical protein